MKAYFKHMLLFLCTLGCTSAQYTTASTNAQAAASSTATGPVDSTAASDNGPAVATAANGPVVTVAERGGRCGPDVSKRCMAGQCCSSAGYCGETTDHCVTGCTPAWGNCGQEYVRTADVSPPPTSPKSDSSSSTAPGANTSIAPLGGRCGPDFNAKCMEGQCCSAASYCGSTAEHCIGGCRTGWGNCGQEYVKDATRVETEAGPKQSTPSASNNTGATQGPGGCAAGTTCAIVLGSVLGPVGTIVAAWIGVRARRRRTAQHGVTASGAAGAAHGAAPCGGAGQQTPSKIVVNVNNNQSQSQTQSRNVYNAASGAGPGGPAAGPPWQEARV